MHAAHEGEFMEPWGHGEDDDPYDAFGDDDGDTDQEELQVWRQQNPAISDNASDDDADDAPMREKGDCETLVGQIPRLEATTPPSSPACASAAANAKRVKPSSAGARCVCVWACGV